MLQKVGDFFKKGSVAGIMLAIISAALLITGKGLADRFTLPGGSPHAAEGAGIELDPQRARDALQNEQNRLQQSGVDLEAPGVLESTKQEVLERLIVAELIVLRGLDQGYRVSAARVQDSTIIICWNIYGNRNLCFRSKHLCIKVNTNFYDKY